MTERKRRRAKLRQVARESLGYDRLRPGQAEAIEAVLDGRDTLAVLPTGLGKSAIYQLAGIQLEGPTVVVSPLIALQKDQVDAIEGQDIGGAVALNSSLPGTARDAAFEALEDASLEFVFLAPEQLANLEVLERLAAAEPSLFVVDEAHCVSDWGHDFRPEYLRLGAACEALGRPTILALTATAAPPVRKEIVERLGMEEPAVVVRGFDRPNIRLAVEPALDEATKREALTAFVAGTRGAGIVYAATRRAAEEVADVLRMAGVEAEAYHAGMAAGERHRVQDAFMSGETRVVVATTAFGMGIDKADVRFVAHHDISGSLDAYFQEIGRAGRDGEPAEARLFYRPEDLAIRRYFAGRAEVDEAELEAVLEAAGDVEGVEELAEATGLRSGRVTAALDLLGGEGALEVGATGEVSVPGCLDDSAIEAAMEAQDRRRQYERSRLEMLRGYAETRGCRRAYLLSYFGEPFEGPCGNCDNCQSEMTTGANAEPPAADAWEFEAGQRVRHRSFGEGQVLRLEPGKVVVLFDEAGYRTLGLELVREQGLLERIATA